jgi:hypothetical protein
VAGRIAPLCLSNIPPALPRLRQAPLPGSVVDKLPNHPPADVVDGPTSWSGSLNATPYLAMRGKCELKRAHPKSTFAAIHATNAASYRFLARLGVRSGSRVRLSFRERALGRRLLAEGSRARPSLPTCGEPERKRAPSSPKSSIYGDRAADEGPVSRPPASPHSEGQGATPQRCATNARAPAHHCTEAPLSPNPG